MADSLASPVSIYHEPRQVSGSAPQGRPPSRSTILKWRLRYAEKGVPTSPADTARKKPVLEGWQVLATTDPRRIHAEFNNRSLPAYDGVLTPTGKKYGRFVLDVDSFEELEMLERLLGVRLRGISTEVRTQSGRLQIHFSWPQGVDIRNSVGKKLKDGFEGLDIRGEGGQVLLPPSSGYSFSNALPTAQSPPELIEWASSRRKAAKVPADTVQTRVVAGICENAEPQIPNGARHDTIASLIGRANDGNRSLAELTELALQINVRQCDPPIGSPGDDDPIEDVVRIARSIHEKEPCRPAARRADEATMRALLAFEKRMEATKWSGHARNRLSLLKTYVLQARRHGELREDGVAVSISNMQAGLANGISDRSVRRNNQKLITEGWLRPDNEDRRPEEAGTVVLLTRAQGVLTHNNSPFHSEGGEVGSLGQNVSGARWSAPRARHGRPVWEGGEYVAFMSRMGKGAETAVDLLERAGGKLHYAELASEMGIKRAGSLFRAGGWLSKLKGADVVEFAPETGEVFLTASWLEAWNLRREQDGEIEDYRRDVKAHERRRVAWRDRLKESRKERRELAELERAAGDEQCRELLNRMDEELELISDVTHLVEVEPGTVGSDAHERPHGDPEESEKELTDLAKAIEDYLERHPERSREKPSWIANTLWCYELVDGKPTQYQVAAALGELAHHRGEAA